MLAKGMHQIPQIEFENCISFVLAFWGCNLPSDTPFLSSMAKIL